MVCCLSCGEIFQPAERVRWVQLRWHFGRGGRRRGRRCRGATPRLTCSTRQLAVAGCYPSAWFLPEVSKSSCHKQLTELAFQFGKSGINKSDAKSREQTRVAAACYSNILLPVSSPAKSI